MWNSRVNFDSQVRQTIPCTMDLSRQNTCWHFLRRTAQRRKDPVIRICRKYPVSLCQLTQCVHNWSPWTESNRIQKQDQNSSPALFGLKELIPCQGNIYFRFNWNFVKSRGPLWGTISASTGYVWNVEGSSFRCDGNGHKSQKVISASGVRGQNSRAGSDKNWHQCGCPHKSHTVFCTSLDAVTFFVFVSVFND